MSGGERKKRGTDKGHGWEEAGAEFYQERYPAAIEADLQQAHIATLLPSKISRVATAKRIRNEPKATLRRRTSTRSRGGHTSTARRMSTNIPDTTVSMLPDLSENLSNEERTWEEIMQIKAMPICMSQKIQLKRQLQSATKLRLQGFEQLKWQRRKAWQEFCMRVNETWIKMELWSSNLKKIGGNFGMGIVSYFLFIKWLMYLNIILFIIIFLFIILPTILFVEEAEICMNNDTNTSIACCSESYWNISRNINSISDIVRGYGILERTLLFYGVYTNGIYNKNNNGIYYNLPLAYIFTIISFFLISLLAIVKSAAKGFKERVVESEGQFYQYCNLIFGGWDFCIENEKSSSIKHKALYNEIKGYLESERLEEERQNRTREEKLKLFFIRLFVNILVVLILNACGILIYYIIDISFEKSYGSISIQINDDDDDDDDHDNNIYLLNRDEINQYIYEFLPSISIVSLNAIIPFIFRRLIALEHYNPLFVVRLSLLRIVFLRLSSLGVLLTSFYQLIVVNVSVNDCTNTLKRRPMCWETFVGQQFFKLYLTDYFSRFFVTFFINFPRSLIAKHSENKILHFIGNQEFDLPLHVLDIIYSQTICWIGTFFTPFLPLITAIGCFFLFYIKKFACLINSTPSSHIYRASRSNSLYMFVVLISFIISIIPVGYSIAEIEPSKSCGPFRGLKTVWTLIINTFSLFPYWIQSILFFFGTAGFGIPAFIILSLLLYYYYAVSIANKHMVIVLKNQLILEGHDKQFLLNRLSAFIKQQQQDQSNDLSNFS